MDGQTDGSTDGRSDGRNDGWTDAWTDEWTDGRMDRGANGWTDGGRTDGQTYMRTDVRTNLRSDGWTYQKKTEERTEGRGEQITFFENVLCIAKIIRMNDLSFSQIFKGSIAGRSDNTEPLFNRVQSLQGLETGKAMSLTLVICPI